MFLFFIQIYLFHIHQSFYSNPLHQKIETKKVNEKVLINKTPTLLNQKNTTLK